MRAALGLLLMLLAGGAIAQSPTTTTGTVYSVSWQTEASGNQSSKLAACSAIAASYNGSHTVNDQYYPLANTRLAGSGSNQICRWDGGPNNLYAVREIDSGVIGETAGGSVTTCPGGSVLGGGGTTCTCPAPTSTWSPSGNVCVSSCDIRAGNMEHVAGNTGNGNQCVNGCAAKPGMTVCLGGGKGYCQTEVKVLNQECGAGVPDSPPGPVPVTGTDTPSPCSAGQSPLVLNGQTLCLQIGKPGTQATVSDQATTTNSDGTKVVTDKTTRCTGTNCVTETVVHNYNSSGTETSSSSSTAASSGVANGTGAGGGGGMCDDELKGTLLCVSLGTPTDETLAEQSQGPSSITPVDVGGPAGACPAAMALPKGMSFSFAPMCSFASGVKPVVLALAWLSAGFIVFGGMRRYA